MNKIQKKFLKILIILLTIIIIAIIIYAQKVNFNQPLSSGGPSTWLWTGDGEVLSINQPQKEITLQLQKECSFFDSMEVTFDYSNLTDITIKPKDLEVGQKITFSFFHSNPDQLYRIYEVR